MAAVIAEEICIIVPTRGRPQSIIPLCSAWEETGAVATLNFVLDDDDPDLEQYDNQFNAAASITSAPVLRHIIPRRRLAGSLNLIGVFRSTTHAAVGFLGDDHRPRTPGWDRRFAECLSGGTGIVYGNDLLVGEKFPTAVVMTSDIPRTLGYMCPPGFVHLCLDLVWRDWAEGIGRITYLPDVIIEHMHPANGKAKFDERYAEVNSKEMQSSDEAAYMKYKVNGLDADLEKLRRLL